MEHPLYTVDTDAALARQRAIAENVLLWLITNIILHIVGILMLIVGFPTMPDEGKAVSLLVYFLAGLFAYGRLRLAVILLRASS